MTGPHSPRPPFVASGLKIKHYRTLPSTRFLSVMLSSSSFLPLLPFCSYGIVFELVSAGGAAGEQRWMNGWTDGWMSQSVQARPT